MWGCVAHEEKEEVSTEFRVHQTCSLRALFKGDTAFPPSSLDSKVPPALEREGREEDRGRSPLTAGANASLLNGDMWT